MATRGRDVGMLPYNTVPMSAERPGSRWTTAVATGGGLAFVLALGYGAWCYAVGFDRPAPPGASAASNAAIDVALFSVFALHHSVFARAGVKSWIVRTVPPVLERSTYVWIASVMFVAVCGWWVPVGGVAWRAEGAPAAVLRGLQLAGVVFTLVAARRLDVLELAGIRQTLVRQAQAPSLDATGPYAIVRHPIYLAWVVMVWSAPVMNGTRLVFAVVSTLYLVAAIPFEERDLRRAFGDAYRDYARRVRWRVIPFVY